MGSSSRKNSAQAYDYRVCICICITSTKCLVIIFFPQLLYIFDHFIQRQKKKGTKGKVNEGNKG